MKLKRALTAIPIITTRKCSKHSIISPERSDEILRSLRRVSQTLGVKQVKERYIKKAKRTALWKIVSLLFVGIFIFLTGILTIIFTPLQMLLKVRLEMTPGLPPFDWWIEPPDVVLLKVYLFNITNSERFLSGLDKRLNVQEVGPIIYREKLVQTNPIFNKNGTLTYSTNRTAVLEPDLNTINLNDTVIVPNLATLLIPGYFHDTSFVMKMAINGAMSLYKSKPFITTTIQEYLWNTTDPILEPAEKFAPRLVPTKNLGILNVVYHGFQNNVTVFIGQEHGNQKFFTIDTYDGSEYLPHFADQKCALKFRNASEGISYPQMITKESNLTYWRKTICKLADIRYTHDSSKYGLNAYNFEFMPWAYNRTGWEGNEDCYKGSPPLPDGLIDVSSCYWEFPMVVSFPHFLNADEVTKTYVNGLTPNKENHTSYVLIEPYSGLPLEGKARSQMNLRINKIWGFSKDFQRFSDTIIPLVWLEYHQVGLPWYIQVLVYIIAGILPKAQLPFSIISLVVGLLCIYASTIGLAWCTRKSNKSFFEEEEILRYEKEAFLKD